MNETQKKNLLEVLDELETLNLPETSLVKQFVTYTISETFKRIEGGT